jgi:protein TonB
LQLNARRRSVQNEIAVEEVEFEKSSMSAIDSGYTSLHVVHPEGDPGAVGVRKGRFGGALGTSVASHALLLLIFYILATLPPPPVVAEPERPFDPNQLVWAEMKGPGGGGGGGGNKSPDPPKKLETKGPAKIAVPVAKAPQFVPPKEIPKPVEEPPKMALNVPFRNMDAGQIPLTGALNGVPSAPPTSQGSGTGGGAGTGTGTGSGPGSGSGLGPGSGGGFGGGVYQAGNGVSNPQLLYEAKPQYTPEAMRAKLQGEVWVSAVVMPDGTTQDVRVIRSLDATFGLDQEAVKAVRQWRFRPGVRLGQPVPVQISVAVAFNLR